MYFDFDNVNKEMLDIFKSSAEATLGAISTLESQAEQMASFLLDNSAALQKQGHRCVEQWVDSTKKNQAELRAAYGTWVESLTDLVWNGSDRETAAPPSAKNKGKK